MSSEGCSLDPLLTGNFVQHLQDRLLSLPPELVAVAGATNGGTGGGASDLESDDSVYYDVDSPGSTCSNTSSPSDTPSAVLDKQTTPTPDTTPEFFDVSEKETNMAPIQYNLLEEAKKAESNGLKEESRFRVSSVAVGHHLLNGDAPRDVTSGYELEEDEERTSDSNVTDMPPAAPTEVSPVIPLPSSKVTPESDSNSVFPEESSPVREYTNQKCDGVPVITSEPRRLPSVVVDSDEECGEMILLDGECYENCNSSSRDEDVDRQEKDRGRDGSVSGGDTEKEDGDEDSLVPKKPELKRCSSLKAAKIAEGISREKKIVRFADALGLDLADVRTFLELEPPKIPKSAFRDLEGAEYSGSPLSGSPNTFGVQQPPAPSTPEKTVVPLFRQPIREIDFMERLNRNKVCLECATVTDVNLFTISGTIRVVNLDFHKHVWVRYTKDNWKNFVDLTAKYVENSCDGFSDKFRFVLFAHTLAVGDRLEFAVKYEVKNCQYWDNNRSANYAFQCVPEAPAPVRAPPTTVLSAYLPSSPSLDSWGSFY